MASIVVVVDDEAPVADVINLLVEDLGHRVFTASDGLSGLELARRERPALVISDIMMPRLDGYQTCALIKNNPQFRHTPVIMLSSKDGLFDKARGRIVGAEQYLTKPFTRDELLGAIQRHVQHVGAGA